MEEDKRQCKVEEARAQAEEAKAKVACNMGGHPKKQVCANTVGSSFTEASTLGVQKVLKVCLYCMKWGKPAFDLLFFYFLLWGLLTALLRSAV